MSATLADVKANWASVNQIAAAVLNAGIDSARELNTDETHLLLALNTVVATVLSQGIRSKNASDVAPLLEAQWNAFVQELRDGLILLDYDLTEGN